MIWPCWTSIAGIPRISDLIRHSRTQQFKMVYTKQFRLCSLTAGFDHKKSDSIDPAPCFFASPIVTLGFHPLGAGGAETCTLRTLSSLVAWYKIRLMK